MTASTARPPRQLHVAVVPALGGAGLVAIVIGTFLPWLRSGQVVRNSYETDGAIRRLLVPDGVAHAALAVWPGVSLACAAVIAIYLLGARGAAHGLALLTALVAAAVGIGALTAPPLGSVSVQTSGPIVTVVGAALILAATSLRFILFVRDDRRSR